MALAGLAFLVVGCSSTGAGTPAAPGEAANSAPRDPIPAVQDPRDVTGIPPCELITPEQLASVGIDQPGEPRESGVLTGRPSCVWQDVARTREVSMRTITGSDGLSNRYAQRDTFPVFEIKEIGRYPVIETQDIVGGTTCAVAVGVAEQQTLTIRFTSLGYGETPPCPEAERIAELVIGNLPPLN